jgi:segregation and condensation protein B
MDLSAVIEALIVASEEPLPTSELARLIRARVSEIEDEISDPEEDGYDAEVHKDVPLKQFFQTAEEDVIAAIAELNHQYEVTGRAFILMERSKGWKIYTRPEYAGFARHLFPGHKPRKLSGPALETLAIVAYRQPVTKAAIEAVRGVSCDGMLQKLLDLELIKIGGRADLPGRPLLYQSTDYFFEHFGIKNIDELPNAAELRYVPLPQPEEHAKAEEAEESEEQQLPLADPANEPPAGEEEEPPADFTEPEPEPEKEPEPEPEPEKEPEPST